MKSKCTLIVFLVLWMLSFRMDLYAQEYVSPLVAAQTGRSPGVNTKLISSKKGIQTYVLIFSPGDEVRSGLTEFAKKYQVKAASYSAIGDATSAKVGYFDYDKKMFKVIPISVPCEVTSLTGDIALSDGEPVVHSHVSLAMEDGSLKGGHLLELIIGPTLEVFVTVYPKSLNKKVDARYNAAVIDPEH